YSAYLYVTRGTSIKGADVFIDPSLVTLSDATPTHMDDVTVTVTVQNRGGTGATFKLEVFDEYSGYNTTGHIIKIDTNLGNPMPENGTYTVSAAGQTTITFVWKGVGTNATGVSMGKVAGNHHLIIKAIDVQGVDGSPEENRYPDVANVGVTVLPKILFVDADQALEGTPNDVSKYYQYLLDTCDYQYTTKRVLGSATLSYDGTLRNYDVVIWETGYYGDGTDTNSAISSAQMNELRIFYDNGGALWIISPEVSPTYLLDYFGLSANAPAAYTGTVTGDPANAYVDLTLSSGAPISTTLINDRSDASNVANVITINPGRGDPLLETNTNKVVGVTLTDGNGKLVYFGFEFSRIEHYYRQNFIGYRVLQWLGNITERLGNDVAVDDFLLSTLHPLYMQPVTITAVVSNNGGQPISTEVMLKIDGIKPPDISPNPNSTGIIPANGGFVYVNFTWVPKSPGLHTIELIADPFNVIKETNEENNYLDSSLLDTNIYVEFSTLIIYNTTAPDANTTDEHLTTLIKAFQDMGYAYQELNVSDASTLPGDYESGDYFTRYNLVIWTEVTGAKVDSTDQVNYIGPRDAEAIYRAEMKASTEFMFVGPKMPEILKYASYDNTGDTLLTDLFGVTIVRGESVNVAGDYVMFGYNAKDSATDGLAYVVQCLGRGAKDIDLLQPTNAPGWGLFRDPTEKSASLTTLEKVYNEQGSGNEQAGYGVATVSTLGSKVMIVPFSMSDVLGIFGLHYTFKPTHPAEQARAQLLFHELRWFGQLEMRPELAVYEPEIQIQSAGGIPKIIVHHSYMIQTTVHNFGDVPVSAVVRFYDDYEWIGTKSVYVGANNETTVEIVWTPMFASHARHVRVVVDPLNTVHEITSPTLGEVLAFNNEAIKTVTVWYFWDNMEYGDQNWQHEATLLNINGETPLDFLARKDVSTNVIGDWDWGYSGVDDGYDTYTVGESVMGKNIFLTNNTKVISLTHGAAHTEPAAYWLPSTRKYALYFDGQKSYVTIQKASLNKLTTWTWSAWVYPSNSGYIYSEGNPLVTFFINVLGNGAIQVGMWNKNTNNYWITATSSSNAVKFNAWNLITITLENGGTGTGTIKFYVNGSLINTANGQEENHDYSKYAAIGANIGGISGPQSLEPFKGRVDELRILDKALDATAINNEYQQSIKTGWYSSTTDTLLWYHFDEGQGNVLKDYSGTDSNGKIYKATWIDGVGTPIRYKVLVTPAIRVGAPYLSFWNYASGTYPNDQPDHI
ncbi:MAG: hypothetical protein GXO25_05760, partial [Euryarchaeota archaeon]|nr:hypothetical protein [Euryarchaeota archaeon]